jgi:hypothetical protein
MTDFFLDIPWHNMWPVLLLLFIGFLSINAEFKRLKGHFHRDDHVLLRALLIRRSVPALAIGVAFLGLFAAMAFNGSIWSWIIGLTCLVISAGFFMLFHVGPLYPLFDELSDADSRANKAADSKSSQQGT